ncbi:MAG: tetraether lipid synthase Tes [Candidatus Aenigmatarchaeota archaeon]
MVTAYPQATAHEKTEINLISTSPYVKNYTEESKRVLVALLPEDVKILKFNQSLCPGCVEEERWDKMKVDAVVYVKDNKVWMTKACADHGVVTEIYWSDYDMYKKAEAFQDPGIKILNPNIDKNEFDIDCPSDCGLCAEHESHTGLGNIVLTNRCDLDCWYCFFYAKEGEPIYEPTLDQIKFMLQRMRDEKPVGANAVQLSLDRDEKILVKNWKGLVSHVRIGNFVDGLMEQNKPKEFSDPIRHDRSDINGWEVMTVNNKLKSVFKPIKSVIRHKNEKDMFKLVTNQGWEITTTGSHSVFVLDSDRIVAKPVAEIMEGDILLGCLNTPEFDEISEINLLDLIKERTPKALDKIVITGFSKTDLKKYEKQEGRKINWDSVSFEVYNKSFKAGKSIRYFNSKKGKELPVKLEITPELFRLLGYYTGEGCTYKNGVLFTFSSKEGKLIEDLLYCVRKVFGKTNIRKRPLYDSALQIYIEGYLYKIFFEILGCGERAIKKQVPWLVFNVNEDLKREFLRAYFKCDGNVKIRKTGFEIDHNTASKDLASDLILLHTNLGIIPKIEVSESRPHMVKKTGQFISKTSKKYRVVIGGKEMLSKALWYLDGKMKKKFERYISTPEKHTPTYLRIPISVSLKEIALNSVDSKNIHSLLHGMRYDKSVSKNNLMEVTDHFNLNAIDFNKEWNDISHSDLGFFKIKRIEKIRPKSDYVYDVSVPGSEAFFAGTGPLLAHNTGGEPTLREDIIDIIKAAREIGYDHVQLNTNGINLSKSLELCQKVREAGSHVLYMSFDGMTPETNPKNYWEATSAIDNCRKAGLGIVLVPTVIGGINDHELGDIIRFGFGNLDTIRSVNFQPVSLVGRMPEKLRKKQRITIPGAIKKIEEQTDGQIGKEHWFPVPCAKQVTDFIEALKEEPKYRLSIHFACGMATYVFKDGDKMVPLPEFFDIQGFFEYLGQLTRELNSSKMKGLKKPVVLGKLMMNIGKYVNEEKKPKDLKFVRMLASAVSGTNYHGLADFHKNSLFLGMMHFQDPYNWDIDRIHKCNIHYAVPDGRILPFCTFNVIPALYRDKVQREFSITPEEWEKKTGKKLDDDRHHRKLSSEEMLKIREVYDKYRKYKEKKIQLTDWSDEDLPNTFNDTHNNKLVQIGQVVQAALKQKSTTEHPAGGCGSGCSCS